MFFVVEAISPNFNFFLKAFNEFLILLQLPLNLN